MTIHIVWDLEDDENGNYWHIVVEGHDVTQEEVDEVLLNNDNAMAVSRSSGPAYHVRLDPHGTVSRRRLGIHFRRPANGVSDYGLRGPTA